MSYDDVLDEVKKQPTTHNLQQFFYSYFVFQIGEVGKFQYIAIGKLYTY